VFLLLQFCTYGQLLELKLLTFLSGTLHALLFISAYCAKNDDDDEDDVDGRASVTKDEERVLRGG